MSRKKVGLPNIANTRPIFENYVRALDAVGLEGVELPVMTDEGAIRKAVQGLDGFIMIGGSDFNPARYGGVMIPNIVKTLSPEMEFFYFTLGKLALTETRRPILGVCLGNQLINLLYGGTLYEDIYTQIPHCQWHSRPKENPEEETMHRVSFTQDSPLSTIFGGSELLTNSSHHQAIKRLGNGLKVIAHADDGIVEAVCPLNFSERFVLGLQWHPERLFEKDANQLNVFKAFAKSIFQQG